MFQFVYWLKALAAILITNSHYADIWPVSAMAAGGHLGNCLFFMVSGFCLYHVKDSFPKWYAKRILRIYPVLWITILFNLLVGYYRIDSFAAFVHCFMYPTRYHFIASVMLLYAMYYLIRKLQEKTGISSKIVILVTTAFFITVYIFCFDKSCYHIDNVEENWVRFQFWCSMMLGAWLREKYDSIETKVSALEWGYFVVLLVSYFAGKLMISRHQNLSAVQFLSPTLLVLLVYEVALLFVKLEKRGKLTRRRVNQVVQFLASITLEIYLVQHPIIAELSGLVFPLNFIVVSGLIVLCAWGVHLCAVWLQKQLGSRIRI